MMADMERPRLLLAFMLTCQLVYATSRGGAIGQIKCNCPPVGGGGSHVPTDPVYSSPPPAGGGRPATPSLTPPYSATPSPTTPRYSPPPSPPAPTFIAPPSPSREGSSSPTTPSVPSYGGTPPSPSSSSSPSVPSYGTPPVPSSSSPSPPVVGTSPSPPDPGVPSTPRGSIPSVPGLPPGGGIIPGLPGSGTGTCNFWGSHPSFFPDILSIFSSISDLFGSGSFYPSKLGRGLTVQEALTNRRKDGYGSLLREGTASLLNSLVNPAFLFSPQDVKNQFNAALRSNKAAAVQGVKFKSANEGRMQ